MLKPVQVPSRAHLSEQSSSEDNDDVWFASSNAHLTGPFGAVLDFLYDVTCTESSVDVTGTIRCINVSGRNNDAIIIFIFSVCLRIDNKPATKSDISINYVVF